MHTYIPLQKKTTYQLLFFAVLVHTIAAWFSVGWHHPDEHYQIIEFTYAITQEKNAGNLPMEFGAGMRPSAQVWLTYGIIKLLKLLSVNNPFLIVFVLRLLTALLSIFTAVKLHRVLQFKTMQQENIHLLLMLFGWSLVYVHVRYSSETWSALFLVLALNYLLPLKNWLLAGVLLGLSFAFRFQIGFAIAGIGIYYLFVQRLPLKNWLLLIIGGLLSIGFASVLDMAFYKQILFTPYNYFYENIINKVAEGFGTEPWFWYLTQTIEQLIPPYSLLVIAGFILLLFEPNYKPIAFACIFFFLGHAVVGHKEMRFIFPLLFFAPLSAIIAWNKLNQLINDNTVKKIFIGLTKLFYPVNLIALLIVLFKPAHELANVYKFCYSLPKNSILYYTQNNPYLSGNNEASFYKPSQLLVQPVTQQINAENSYLFVEDNSISDISNVELIEVYNSIPNWLYHFNFNNWLERSNNYKIFKIEVKKHETNNRHISPCNA